MSAAVGLSFDEDLSWVTIQRAMVLEATVCGDFDLAWCAVKALIPASDTRLVA